MTSLSRHTLHCSATRATQGYKIGSDTICHNLRNALATSVLYPKMISQVTIRAPHIRLYQFDLIHTQCGTQHANETHTFIQFNPIQRITICYDSRNALATSMLYPKRTSQVTIKVPRNHLYRPV